MRTIKYDYTRGLSFFELVCKKIGVDSKSEGNLKRLLKNTTSGKKKDPTTNEPYCFKYGELYNTLRTNKHAKDYLKQYNLQNWSAVVKHFAPSLTK